MPGSAGSTHQLQRTKAGGAISAGHSNITRIHSRTAEDGSGRGYKRTTCQRSPRSTHVLQSTRAGGTVSAQYTKDQQNPLTDYRAWNREGPSACDVPGINIHPPTAEHGSGRSRQYTTCQGSAGSTHRLQSIEMGATISTNMPGSAGSTHLLKRKQ